MTKPKPKSEAHSAAASASAAATAASAAATSSVNSANSATASLASSIAAKMYLDEIKARSRVQVRIFDPEGQIQVELSV